jgi:hypothetical protein
MKTGFSPISLLGFEKLSYFDLILPCLKLKSARKWCGARKNGKVWPGPSDI